MKPILSIQQLSIAYGYQTVLTDVSFTVHTGERVGIVGANGVGKTTLLRIIRGELTPDTGSVIVAPSATLGYMAQARTDTDNPRTINAMIEQSLQAVRSLETQMRHLEQQMTTTDDLDTVLHAYAEAAEHYERAGGYTLDAHVGQIMAGLRLDTLDRARPFETLSGGEKRRVELALLLLSGPDVLLLDEPTNHLDFVSMAWLESYLLGYRGSALLVSHDRHFLNRTASAIVEIDEHSRTARRYNGSYDAFAAAKALEKRQWWQTWEREQEEIRLLKLEVKEVARRNDGYRAHSDNDKFIRNFKIAQHDHTVSKRVRAAEEKLARLLANATPQPPRDLRFQYDLDAETFRGSSPLWASRLVKAYDERAVLNEVSLDVGTHSRIVLVGANGTGKSTLLRILAGNEPADTGEVYRHPAARIGYLAQEADEFDTTMPAFEAYMTGLEGPANHLKSQLIEMGLFQYDALDKPLGALSIGQRYKLQLARLIAQRANVLILDEPTNHVSFDVVEGLEAALRSFPGAVIAVSHDRRFINAMMSHPHAALWAMDMGHLRLVTSGYDELLAARQTQ